MLHHTRVLNLTYQFMHKNGATSFSRNVISPNRRFVETSYRRMSNGRIIILPNSKIAETI